MYSALTTDEMMEWRRSTEKITLEEFAARLGKAVVARKETNDLHDMLLKQGDEEPEENVETETTNITKDSSVEEQKPDFGIKITFSKKLNKREEVVFNYFCKNRKQKVMVKDIANILGLPNDYVYKYIKNLRSKLSNTEVLVNADQGGYILDI